MPTPPPYRRKGELFHSNYTTVPVVDVAVSKQRVKIYISMQFTHILRRFGSLDIQSHNGHNGPGPGQAEEEQQSYLNQVLANQVAALEESKQLLTAELIAARQQLTQLEADHVPGGKVLERANQLAAENVGLKAAVDELTGERVTLQDRISSLEAEKASRDSKDDTAVLKQELINVQRAMDEALKEKEEEFNKLRKSYDDLFYEKQNLIDTVSQKDGELTSMKNKLSDVNGDKSTLEESYQTESQQLTDEKEKLTLKLKEKDDMIKARDDKILNLSRTLEQKITLLEDKLENEKELKAIIEESKSLSRSKSEEIDKIQMSFEALQKKESKAMEKLEAQEASIIEHQEKLLLEKKEKDSINSALNSTEARVSKLTSEAEERTSAMHNLNVELEEKTTEISRLQSERQELLAKIEAGEGVSEAIQQLKAENLLLQDKVSDNLNDFKVRESDLNSKIEDLEASIVSLKTQCKEMESKYKETLESGEDKQKLLQHSEAEKEVLLSQVSEMEREVERLKEVQKKSVMDHEDAMTAIQDDLREKDKVYQKIKSKCDKAEQDILALEDSVRELESKLSLSNSEKDTLVESNEKLTETVTKEKQHVEKLLRSLNDANDRDAECIEKIKSLEDKLKEEAQNIKLLKQAKTLVQEEKYGIEKLLEEKSTECQDKVVVLEANRFRIQELETGLADTEVKVNEMRTAIEEAVGKERNLLSDIEEKNKTIFAIEEEKASIVISFESQQTILERLTGEKDSAEGQVRKCKAEMESLEEKICQLQTHSEMEKTKSAEEMMELRTAKDLLLSQIVDLKHDKESLAASIVLETEASQARVAALEIKLQDSKLGQEKVRGELDRERTQHADTQRRGGEEREDLARRLEEAGTKVAQLTEEGAKVRDLLATAETER